MNDNFWCENFQVALVNAVFDRPNRKAAERKLFRIAAFALGEPLLSAAALEPARSQMSDNETAMVRDIALMSISEETLSRIDHSSIAGAAALLARIVNPQRPSNIDAAIEAELAEASDGVVFPSRRLPSGLGQIRSVLQGRSRRPHGQGTGPGCCYAPPTSAHQ